MATITATIVNAAIISQVEMVASFAGRNAKDKDGRPLYDEVRITAQDDTLLAQFIGEAKRNLLAAYADISSTDLSGNIVFTLPAEYLTSHATSIQAEVVNFITDYVCRCWFELHLPDKVEEYQAKGALSVQKLNDLLYSREAPAMPNGTQLPNFISLT